MPGWTASEQVEKHACVLVPPELDRGRERGWPPVRNGAAGRPDRVDSGGKCVQRDGERFDGFLLRRQGRDNASVVDGREFGVVAPRPDGEPLQRGIVGRRVTAVRI